MSTFQIFVPRLNVMPTTWIKTEINRIQREVDTGKMQMASKEKRGRIGWYVRRYGCKKRQRRRVGEWRCYNDGMHH